MKNDFCTIKRFYVWTKHHTFSGIIAFLRLLNLFFNEYLVQVNGLPVMSNLVMTTMDATPRKIKLKTFYITN